MKRPSKKKLIALIHKSSGIVYPIAQSLGVARSTVYYWIHSDEDLEQAFSDARESTLDVVESKYFKAAVEGSERAQEFLLKTLGKDRGYVERKDISADVSGDGFVLRPLTSEEIDELKKMSQNGCDK
jgi:AcrR family transcriptional regulator